ncbi:hypothetical protein ACIRU3_42200 [Streptomyces sp. NPDC101151]|uniref:hypothetical protein n=1 Tax=Streptomyces sp. NPDC101151 TaxID=3366115 RepID=UPI00382A7A52
MAARLGRAGASDVAACDAELIGRTGVALTARTRTIVPFRVATRIDRAAHRLS